jgi:hypothetical protein
MVFATVTTGAWIALATSAILLAIAWIQKGISGAVIAGVSAFLALTANAAFTEQGGAGTAYPAVGLFILATLSVPILAITTIFPRKRVPEI